MDPLTHGLLGATASQCLFSRHLGRYAPLIGAAAAMLPDLDVVINSAQDPLLGMMVHRGFTHALVFIPIGAAIASLPFLWVKSLRYRRRMVFTAALAAIATHGFLDALTSYGTQLFWPLTDWRVSLDWMPIIDPIFTFTLLLGVIIAAVRRSVQPARIAMMAACLYIGLGAIQRQRALNVQLDLADSRFNVIERRRVMPTLGNLVVWRSLYQVNDRLQADMIRIPPVGEATYRPGERITLLTPEALQATAPAQSVTGRDVERFSWFADGFLAVLPDDPNRIGDMRYSMEAHRFQPLWAIRIDPDRPDQHVTVGGVSRDGSRRDAIARLWRDIWRAQPDDARAADIGVLDATTR